MSFTCGSPNAQYQEPPELSHQHSVFGDAYSIGKMTSTRSVASDCLEADYDQGATKLYQYIENKDWDAALNRLEQAPVEARTWVYRLDPGSQKMRWRLLPLHAVCIFRAPLQLMEALIEAYPDGPKLTDDQGMLPVHLACRNGASKGVVLTLLQAHPESINARDRKQRVPADLVQASHSANKDVVLQAIARFQQGYVQGRSAGSVTVEASVSTSKPEATTVTETAQKEVDYEHRTLLFRLVLKKDWKAAAARAATHPDEAATFIVTKGFNGNLRFLPLHKACVLQPPVSMVQALLKAYPQGVACTDQDGWLPLHCACFYGADEDVVNALLQANLKAAQSKDDEGRLPLHYACLKGASQGVVDVLLASYSKGCNSKDDEGRLPIHHACSKGAPEGIIDALLKASPKGAQSKDDQGRLPLHHACRKNASERILRTLLRVYPRAAQIKDDQDKLALHYACHNPRPTTVSLLLQTYPESVHVKNGFGYTPLAEAQALDNPKMDPVIKVLEKFAKQQDGSGKSTSSETAQLEQQVVQLQDQVDCLEKKLSKMADIGKDLQKDLRKNKDPADILSKLSEKLVATGASTKTPLKHRQSTPSRLFGRKSNSATKAKA